MAAREDGNAYGLLWLYIFLFFLGFSAGRRRPRSAKDAPRWTWSRAISKRRDSEATAGTEVRPGPRPRRRGYLDVRGRNRVVGGAQNIERRAFI